MKSISQVNSKWQRVDLKRIGPAHGKADDTIATTRLKKAGTESLTKLLLWQSWPRQFDMSIQQTSGEVLWTKQSKWKGGNP